MKIILLTQYFPPEVAAGANRAYEHAMYWIKLGAEVTVITCFPNYPSGIKPNEYKGLKYLEEIIDGIRVIRTFTYATPNKGFFRRSISYLSFMLFSVIQSYNKIGKQDVIIATSPPFTVGIAGMLLAKLKKIPLVFEVRDLWPESIVQLGQIKNRMVIKLLEFFELYLYNYAKHIVCVTDSFVPIIAKKGIEKSKISVIKNGVDLEIFKPRPQNITLLKQLNLENKFVVGYFGTLGLSHAVDKVLESAKLIHGNKKIKFLIIGEGAEREKLLLLKEKLNLSNVSLINNVDKKKLIDYYSIANLMLVSLRNIPLFKTVIPSKMFEIMSVGKPFILLVNGEAKEIVEKAQAGFFCPPEKPNQLAQLIQKLADQQDVLDYYSKNGRKFVENNFDRKKLAKKYFELLNKII